MSQAAQAAVDYLILTAVVIVVLIPLFYYSAQRIDYFRISEVSEAVKSVKEGVVTISNLGYGTATRVVIQLPSGILSTEVTGTLIKILIAGQEIIENTKVSLFGVFPQVEGRHYVKLFNNGTNVLIYECGNNITEAFEQCDGPSVENCGTGFSCIDPGSEDGCKCSCVVNNDCPDGFTCLDGACEPTGECGDGVIQGPIEQCEQDSDCLSGYFCDSCQCVGPSGGACGDGILDAGEACDPPENTGCITDSLGNFCDMETIIDFENCQCIEYCGDGIIQPPNDYNFFEECDDGNLDNNDSCNTNCEKTDCISLGMVSYWKFDDVTASASGVTTPDYVDGNNAKIYGASTVSTAIVGNALSFDGTDDSVGVTDSLSLDNFAEMSIEFWFKSNEAIPGTSPINSELFDKRNGKVDGYESWFNNSGQPGSGRLVFNVCQSSSCTSLGSVKNSWLTSQWYHTVLTFGSGSLKIYVDGALNNEVTTTLTSTGDSTNNLNISRSTESPTWAYKGIIDEFAVYNTVLPESTILEHNNSKNNYCYFPWCPNGYPDPGESCDPGTPGVSCSNPSDTCNSDCTCTPSSTPCGDGDLDPGESCDPGTPGVSCLNPGDICNSDCTCSPGGSSCDGNCDPGDSVTCPSDCPPVCGDGWCSFGEYCTCLSDCWSSGPDTCGDNICNCGETSGTCSNDCWSGGCDFATWCTDPECNASCGDGLCACGETSSSCPLDCTSSGNACGDGICAFGEDCNTCVRDCGTCPVCGNGKVEQGEQCEQNTDCPVGFICVNCACIRSPGGGGGEPT